MATRNAVKNKNQLKLFEENSRVVHLNKRIPTLKSEVSAPISSEFSEEAKQQIEKAVKKFKVNLEEVSRILASDRKQEKVLKHDVINAENALGKKPSSRLGMLLAGISSALFGGTLIWLIKIGFKPTPNYYEMLVCTTILIITSIFFTYRYSKRI